MFRQGIISDLNESSARVIFPDLNDAVSGWLSISKLKVKCLGNCDCTNCIATLDVSIGSSVIVCLYDGLNSGIIIAKLE
ncbi:hypothetical protein FDA33_11880 [Clostridium botulinum]|nr:hypothetical protein [Clostridium botulinum]NFI17327.1 hypothetical protein [Clostridium botulinum]NFL92096.1 hypothetical protein [Clostridium botulinum]NFN52130.1 hypothetical protein [Clostridium botulinum]NFO26657.1 hypothetical protein [Clostridium botulinum]